VQRVPQPRASHPRFCGNRCGTLPEPGRQVVQTAVNLLGGPLHRLPLLSPLPPDGVAAPRPAPPRAVDALAASLAAAFLAAALLAAALLAAALSASAC